MSRTHFGLTPNEQGTRFFFGKPYHWWADAAGVLGLVPGYAPGEEPKIIKTVTAVPGPTRVGDKAIFDDGTEGTVVAVAGDTTYMEKPVGMRGQRPVGMFVDEYADFADHEDIQEAHA